IYELFVFIRTRSQIDVNRESGSSGIKLIFRKTMDPQNSVQDVHRCDLCETAIVHSYCDFCHVNLCIACIGKHISNGYDKHKIVPFQERRSTLIYPICRTHSHKNCKFQCKDCDKIFICSSCTASEQHRGHTFLEVSKVYNTKKEIIGKDTKELENLISPTYEKIALDLESHLANLDGGYEKLTTTISKQGEQWHREIDTIINKMKTEISEIKVKHTAILQKYLVEIKHTQSLITNTLQAIRKIEQSTEVSSTIEYRSKLTELRKLPPKVQVSLPTFIPKPIDRETLCSLFGHITPLSTDTEENVLSLNQSKTSVIELLGEPVLVATIQTWYQNLRSVACLNDDCVWTCGLTNDMKCFSTIGSLLQTVKTKSEERPSDIAVDKDGNLLYSIRTAGTVFKVKNGQTKDFIRLHGWGPCNLCVTSTGDLLVTMCRDDKTQSKVVRFSKSTEKQTIQFDDKGKPLYSGNDKIKYISENGNHNICVADWYAHAIVVVNQDGKLRWRYTGHPSVTGKKSFDPCGITTDSQNRILTADSDNHCIHILDQNGQFLSYIDKCDLKDPWGVCVDNNDSLFVCEYYKSSVKKRKYLK
uniref:B box-type domain-containing protein n=2 Tax=Magallana gigas TaxID=29159 RepID=A0A8W8MR07_MAGGI